MKHWLIAGMLITMPWMGALAEEVVVTNTTAMVMFEGKELFKLSNVATLSPESRTKTLVDRLKKLARSPLVSTKDLYLYHDPELKISAIMDGQDIVLAVWEHDAKANGVPREKLAEYWKDAIADAILQYRMDHTASSYLRGIVFSAIATVVFFLIWLALRSLCNKEIAMAERRFHGKKMLRLLDGESIVSINGTVIKLLRRLIMLTAFIFYLNIVLSFFPWTFNLSARLFDLISAPVIKFGHAFVENLPNLFAIGVIILITNFILRGFKHIFAQIAEGKVRIKGFYQDWAETTYGLTRMVVVVFAAVVAFPFIPGSSSPAFKGISIFMGVLVSLGSSSAVGNVFGGLMLTYMRSFQPGDFVEINGMKGTVMASRTFATRLKTPTNEIISIPNAAVSSNHIINYSRMTKSVGVNIGTDITIGYDVPWRKVHELLLKSAEGVPDVLEDPAPIILQLGLEDYYVKYKLVISTKNPAGKFRILSNLHQNIQDNFAAAGVEIMSPHYQANRSGEASTIPQDMGIPAAESPEA